MSITDERRLSCPEARAGKSGCRRLNTSALLLRKVLHRRSDSFFSIFLWLLLAGVWVSTGGAMPAAGQTDVNDVHVMPRTIETAKTEEVAKQTMVTPGLNTHVRPFKVAVDLVLVPVTIT